MLLLGVSTNIKSKQLKVTLSKIVPLELLITLHPVHIEILELKLRMHIPRSEILHCLYHFYQKVSDKIAIFYFRGSNDFKIKNFRFFNFVYSNAERVENFALFHPISKRNGDNSKFRFLKSHDFNIENF